MSFLPANPCCTFIQWTDIVSAHTLGLNFSSVLAALSSSGSLVVSRSVRPSVRPLVMFVKKWPLEYCKVIRTYLPTYLWDSSETSDICDSCDRSDDCDSCDRSDSFDKKNVVIKILWLKLVTKILRLQFCDFLPTYKTVVTLVTFATVVTLVIIVTLVTVVTVVTKRFSE